MDNEVRAAVKQHIKWALAGFDIPDEYHHEIKDDPLYVPGEPINVLDFLPSIRHVDPGGQELFDQLVEAVVIGLEKALFERGLRIVPNQS